MKNLNNTINPLIKEVSRKNRKYIKLNKKENITYQNVTFNF